MNSIDVERKRKEEDEDTRYLEKYLLHLEARIKEYQNIILHLKSDISKNENEIKSLKKEIDSLSESPLITGEVEDMLDELTRRVIVRINSGATYIVNSSNRLTNQELSPGQQVALNQRNFSVVEALPQNIEPYIKNMVVEGKTTGVSYSDIGGLENQIQEVRESVELPLLKPEIFIKIGIEAPKGALFYGPP